VQATEICAEGDWSTGLRLLQVCRVALLHHPAPLLYKPLGDLLRFVATFYSDVCSYLCSYLNGLFGQARVYSVSTAVTAISTAVPRHSHISALTPNIHDAHCILALK
jgi:hypothetical protein